MLGAGLGATISLSLDLRKLSPASKTKKKKGHFNDTKCYRKPFITNINITSKHDSQANHHKQLLRLI